MSNQLATPVHRWYPLLVLHTRSGERGNAMARQDILDQISQTLGAVPGWLAGMPDPQLKYQWGMIAWVLSDTVLSARDKALVSFGAAAAAHCPY